MKNILLMKRYCKDGFVVKKMLPISQDFNEGPIV